jgi:hypothetical protein
MTNKEIAQEQINKEKQEARIELIKSLLCRKESYLIKIKKIDEDVEKLETKEMEPYFGECSCRPNYGLQEVNAY